LEHRKINNCPIFVGNKQQKITSMKKVFLLATAAFLFTGFAFAHGDGKKCGKGKDCCKDSKECKMNCKDEKKDAKAETKTTAKAGTTKATKA
jgi:hypothetical protein